MIQIPFCHFECSTDLMKINQQKLMQQSEQSQSLQTDGDMTALQ
jgi:hypothetical protein